MGKMYYDRFEFEKIVNMSVINPFQAKDQYLDYLDKYPDDYRTYFYFVSLLVEIQEFDEAKKILDYIEPLIEKGNHYINKKENFNKLNLSIIWAKLKFYMYQGNYEEAYKIYISAPKRFDGRTDNIILYLENKLGYLKNTNRETYRYLKRQIIEYQEDDFFRHIQKHQANYNMDIDERNNNIFNHEVDMKKLVTEIKKYIPSSKRLFEGFIEDCYYFKYDECGKDGKKIANYIKVICFHDTNEFITMLPVLYGEYLPYVDLNYMKEESKSKVKRISQTEKFYKRYHM